MSVVNAQARHGSGIWIPRPQPVPIPIPIPVPAPRPYPYPWPRPCVAMAGNQPQPPPPAQRRSCAEKLVRHAAAKALPCATVGATVGMGMGATSLAFFSSTQALASWALALHFSPEHAPQLLALAIGGGLVGLATPVATWAALGHARRIATDVAKSISDEPPAN